MRRLILYAWFIVIVRPVTIFFIGVTVFGRQHLNHTPPVIIIANHNSHLDAAMLMSLLPLRLLGKVRPVAAADYFEKGLLRRFVGNVLMNALMIRRDKVTRKNNPLTAMLEALDSSQSLILFPEGTRGEPEESSELKTGIAHVIRKRPDVQVIPVYMRNLGFSLPRGDFVLVPMFCDIFVGVPRCLTGTTKEIMANLTASFESLQKRSERLRSSEIPHEDR